MSPPKRRRPRGEGAIYKRPDGLWAAAVDLGYTSDGRRRRKVVTSKDHAVVVRKLRELKRNVEDHGNLPTAGITVRAWLTEWLETIAADRVKPRTLATYSGYCDNYLIPHLGRRRLDQLQPEHIRATYKAMTAKRPDGTKGLSTTTALQAHRILTKALEDALREGKVTRNVAKLMDAPRKGTKTRGALTVLEAVTLLRSVTRTPLGSRWGAALLLGARQGECLGLEWDRVDLDAGTVDLAWQLQRLRFRHGCAKSGDAWACGLKRAGSCPSRELAVPDGFEWRDVDGSGLVLTRPKSSAGVRLIPLPRQQWDEMRWHHDRTSGTGLVWTRADGRPIDPKDDSAAWHAALDAAGLPSVPLHAARHTTGTLLGRLRVPTHVVSAIMGHSSAAVTLGYQQSDLTLERDALDQLGDLLALD